jgi:hypothetical protein
MSQDDLRPARSARGRDEPAAKPDHQAVAEPEAAVEHDEAAALERGRTTALVAALGRVQMSLDILTRKVAALEETVRAQSRAASQSAAAPAAQASTSVPGGGADSA